MKTQNHGKKVAGKKAKAGKMSGALTGPGLLTSGELDEASGGLTAGTTARCTPTWTANGTR